MNTQEIPVINIQNLLETETLKVLDDACRQWGFFQVIGHGIPREVIDRLHQQMRWFFFQPQTDKRAISRTATNPWGFFDQELTKNTRDWKEIYDFGPGDGKQLMPQWPSANNAFKKAVTDFYTACETLGFRLLSAISLNLGMGDQYLADNFLGDHSSFLRLNYYPVCPNPERPQGTNVAKNGHLGINHHTDAGALTLLLQDDQPGLEVFRNNDWHLVTPRRDALVINIGDIVQVWSNDEYKASLHRVIVNPNKPRFSAPFFFNPRYETNYKPLPSTVSKLSPARYRTINWGEFRARRAAGDYADYGEEVQISHFRAVNG